MLICRYESDHGPQSGVIDDGKVYQLRGLPFEASASQGQYVSELANVTLLPPTMPSKIVCVGRNYADHAQELGNEVPVEPLLFFKPPSALIGHGKPIELLSLMGEVHHEAELAIVIGRGGRFISEDAALDHVGGYTCANDVSDRDFQRKDGQWTRAKGFDTFCPLGPWIRTDINPSNLAIQCLVNGEVRQNASTSLLIFSIPKIISYISTIMTLEIGDVILTGTPAGVGRLSGGDVVRVEIEGIGVLENPVLESAT
jgi:2-keto-4-pentenoate hydratase/2-oxohepta-3-ene-1,7-dioic acid hydratase in catechol pathway